MSRILLVDDSASILQQVSSWLTEAGHDVLTLNSAQKIGPVLQIEQLDLVITDIYMPDFDGLELLRLVRRIRPELPCLAMSSAEGAMNALPIARVLGAVSTLRKPFTAEQLYQSVGDILAPKSA